MGSDFGEFVLMFENSMIRRVRKWNEVRIRISNFILILI